jgi:hypothetical protein
MTTTEGEDFDQLDGGDRPLREFVSGQQLSEVCVSGTIQLIFLAEHQTTGIRFQWL